ncbi:MAG: asparaginase [Clostridium sp.]|nr:asparaginase [Clostridium sp.]
MPDRKKILMVATGGTIASMDEGHGLTPKLTTKEILSTIPEVRDICHIEALQLMNLDSTNIGPKEWQEIAECILREYDNYDGFVVTHGTDTMAYTAAALSYMIQKSPKPVVITGSQKSIFLRDTDARVNLLDSFVYAADPGSWGVSIVFNGKAILGTRARKERSKSYNAFNSVDYPEAAVIRNGRVIRYLTRPSLEDGPVISTNMEGRILLLTLIPGMSAKVLQNSMEDYDAVILRSFGVGGLPGSDRGGLAEALREWTEHGKLVVMMTQVPYEGSDMNVYQVGQKIKHELNMLEGYDMTMEAVVTKLMWIMGQTRDPDRVREFFYTPVQNDLVQ